MGGHLFVRVDGAIATATLTLTTYPGYPKLFGALDFTATGGGTFEEPRYDVKWSVSDVSSATKASVK